MEHTISDLVEGYEKGRLTRRQLIQSLALLAGTAATSRPAALSAAQQASSLRVFNVNHIGITVSDVNRSREFYKRVLNLNELTPDDPDNKARDQVAFMGFGSSLRANPVNTFLVLRPPAATKPGPGAPLASRWTPPGSYNHLCFSVDNYNTEAVFAQFKKLGVTAEVDSAKNWESPGIEILDPDGLLIQIGSRTTHPL